MDDRGRHRHRRHLAAGDFGAGLHGLTVDQGEHGNRAQAVDTVDRAGFHPDQAPPRRQQPDLRLRRWARFQAGPTDRAGQADRGFVFMEV